MKATKLSAPVASGELTQDSDATVRRAMAVMCLVAIAVIHLLDTRDKYDEVAYIGVLFVLLVISSMVLAEMLARRDDPLVWLASGALAGATLLGFILSRTIGLPGEGGEEIGHWFSSLAMSSMLFEAYLVWLVAVHLGHHRLH